MHEEDGVGDGTLLVAVQRADALDALADGPLRRAELEDAVGVSRTTAHRILHALADRRLVERVPAGYALTPLGAHVSQTVRDARADVGAARVLEPFLDALADTEVDLDVSLFADATVTSAGPGDPYAPVRRFVDLLAESDRLRGFDTTTIAPVYVEEMLDGTETSVVYLPDVARRIADAYPERVAAAVDAGRLRLYTSASLPFGLALFDDRVGLGAYEGETGLLARFVDTANPAAREWAEALYERYRSDAEAFLLPAEG